MATQSETPNEGVLHSNSTISSGLAKAPTDTFTLFGGPGTTDGKFEDINGVVPDRQGWIGVDLTDEPVYWQLSTLNAENLSGHGPGNIAAWCGQSAVQQAGWVSPPGYGNRWDEYLIFESPALADPSVGQIVSLDFFFNFDTELNYDFFQVQYDSAGTWITIGSFSGTNQSTGVYPAPGTQFAANSTGVIQYAGNDYGGNLFDRVRIRLRFTSDAAWSDEDGLFSSNGGAVQIDDISVVWSDGSDFEDFESGFVGNWKPYKRPFAGDFSKTLARVRDIEPCRENQTPVMAFIDDGTSIAQCQTSMVSDIYGPAICFIPHFQLSPTWNYGVTDGYVVNYTGGVSGGLVLLNNEVWSPEITWDLPGAADDGPDVVGATIRYSMWDHLPLLNGIVATWHVRSSSDGVVWTEWRNNGFFWTGTSVPQWRRFEIDITPYLLPNPLVVQVALGVKDIKETIFFPNDDATISPVYDNVSLVKYRVGGPDISTPTSYLAQSGFPASGNIGVSTQAARDNLDIRFDMARDIASGPVVDSGDSIVATVKAVLPGTTVTDLRLVWMLYKNPLFEDAIRSTPARAVDENVVTTAARWNGEVVGTQVTLSTGFIVADKYFFDLPDTDLLYPGDILWYYIRATDGDGRVTTLPEDVSGFTTGNPFDPRFVIYGLPSILDASGSQPTKLIIAQGGSAETDRVIARSVGALSFSRGYNYDVYSNGSFYSGIGAAGAHGATLAQLGGYDTIVIAAESAAYPPLGDGTSNNSDDLGLLTAWHSLPGIRNALHFGDDFVSTLVASGAAGTAYVQDIMGVNLIDNDVRDEIEMQTTPTFLPLDPNFAVAPVAYGGCPTFQRFDSIGALPAAFRAHGFVDNGGIVYPGIAASVIHERFEYGDRKVDATFPFGLTSIRTPMLKQGVNTSARTEVLREVFGYFGVSSGGTSFVAAPSARSVALRVYPNPFNPRTTVSFDGLADGVMGSVRVLNLRGELVVTLHDGEFTESEFVWNGTDSNDRSVASGVYVIEATVGAWHQNTKVALLK